MNPQAFSDLFGRFVRHPALLGPVRQLLERDVYLFQCVINMKRPFHGAVWQWHQDFPTYFHDDAMPEPRLVNALVFIDEVREFKRAADARPRQPQGTGLRDRRGRCDHQLPAAGGG